MSEKRVTKRENFERIVALLQEMEGTEDLVQVMQHEIELVSKKRATQTKAQKANEGLAQIVYDILKEATEPMTATQIANVAQENGVEDIKSNQKVSALLKILENKVVKETKGKKSTFRVATEDEMAEVEDVDVEEVAE